MFPQPKYTEIQSHCPGRLHHGPRGNRGTAGETSKTLALRTGTGVPLGPRQGGRSAASPLRRAPLGASALNPDGGSFTAHGQVVARPHSEAAGGTRLGYFIRETKVGVSRPAGAPLRTQRQIPRLALPGTRVLTAALLRSAVWSPPPTPSSRPPPDAGTTCTAAARPAGVPGCLGSRTLRVWSPRWIY